MFETTHWSVVIAAGEKQTTAAQDALTTLCETYWRPIYSYVRRRGYASTAPQLTVFPLEHGYVLDRNASSFR